MRREWKGPICEGAGKHGQGACEGAVKHDKGACETLETMLLNGGAGETAKSGGAWAGESVKSCGAAGAVTVSRGA
jgi:hypothetical protein